MPKISIIVPVYKVEKYLRRCLDSIVAQSFPDWECILVDDGSPDNSGKICDEYAGKDVRFKAIHQESAGVSAARNKGLDEAKGEWIGFVDSDDWIEQDMLSDMLLLGQKDNSDIVVCGYRTTGIGNDVQFFPNDFDFGFMVDNFHSGTRIVKNIYIKKNQITFPEKITLAEDWWYNYQLCVYNPKQSVVNKIFYNYFQNSESVMHSLSKKNIMDAINITKFADTFPVKNEDLLTNRKIICKFQILTNTKDFKLYRTIFPEVDKKIWKQSSIKKKVVLLFISLHFDFVVRLLYKIKNT